MFIMKRLKVHLKKQLKTKQGQNMSAFTKKNQMKEQFVVAELP